MIRRVSAWLLVLAATVALTVHTSRQALDRYETLKTGWSWDLAYYNQWFWALTGGDGHISVRPIASYADEGPSVWKMNYLAPIRFALVPFYLVNPDPRTLLIIQNVIMWWCLPAAFGLVRRESGSDGLALSAVALVPLTPLLWPLVWNDFRELQLALPFVIWAIDGVRGRRLGPTCLGVGGMLACRQEYALVVAMLGIIGSREPEDVGRSYRWARALFLVGLVWMLFAFFGYLRLVVGTNAPALYRNQFAGPRASPSETVETAFDFLAVGLGSWAVLACLAPRVFSLALPWLLSLAGGRWSLRLIGTTEWHHVRYTAPFVILTLAAGLVGYARRGRRLLDGRDGRGRMLAAWCVLATGLLLADRALLTRFSQVPRPVSAGEAAAIWTWIDRVGPDEAVLAAYEVAAPLSSRRLLSSYVMHQNRPKGYPDRLGPEYRWVFLKNGDIDPEILARQGFERVHSGESMSIFRRRAEKSVQR